MLALTKTKDPQVIQNYFNAYPNNIFLTIIFAGIKYLSSLFGCVDNYFPTIVAGVISTDAAIVFTVMTVWKLTHSRKVTFLSIIICTVFLGFNMDYNPLFRYIRTSFFECGFVFLLLHER